MKRLCLLVAAFLPALPIHADTGTWKCYVPGNQIQNIDISGDHIWCATNGSIVRWNIRDSTYTQYTTLDGLLDTDTHLVSADPSGGAWVTYNRVNAASRFDGFSWTHFDRDRGGLPASPVHALHVDSKGRAWLGYDLSGIFMYDGMSWTHFMHDAAFSSAPLHVAIGRAGIKWVSTKAGAVAVSDSGYRVYTADDGLAGNTVRMTGIAPDGAVWFCTSTGVSRLYQGILTTWRKEDGLASSNVFSLAFAPDGSVWFATDRGVSRFDGAKWTSYTDTDGLIAKKSNSIAVDGAGRVWACHPGETLGVSRFENGTWAWTSTWNSGITGNRVYNVCSAPDGAVWFATDTGLSRFDGEKWTSWTTRDGLISYRIGSVAVDSRGRVWVMYHEEERKGVSVLDNGTITSYTTSDGLRSDIVTAAAPDGDAVWFCTGRGLCRFDGSSWTNYPANDRLLSSTINDIAEDPAGTIWFATNRGLSRYDGAEWRTYTVDDGLPADVVKTVAAGNDGRIWVVSDSTLVEFNGRTFIPHPVEKTGQAAFFRQQIAGIAVDTHNRVTTNLISLGDVTADAPSTALFRFSSTGWETFPSHARYYSKGNHPVAAGEDDTIWAGSYDGLIRQTDPQQF